MPKPTPTSDSYVSVKIYGIYDAAKKEVIKVSLDQSEIDMEMVLLGEKPNLKECIMEVTLLMAGVEA